MAILISGCAAYHAPGRGADFTALGIAPELQKAGTSGEIQAAFDKRPLASFPAGVAVVRIQEPGYRSETAQSWGHGAYSIVTTRDIESDDCLERLRKLQYVRGIATLSRLIVPSELKSDQELRRAAATLQCDMLLIYTLDTTFHDRDAASPITLISLGLAPTRVTNVVTTASAVLFDTRNGYVYGMAEASTRREGLATSWNTSSAIDGDRRRTETEAFEKLVGEIEIMWKGVVREVGPGAAPKSARRYPTSP